jgi:hypothetical protein
VCQKGFPRNFLWTWSLVQNRVKQLWAWWIILLPCSILGELGYRNSEKVVCVTVRKLKCSTRCSLDSTRRTILRGLLVTSRPGWIPGGKKKNVASSGIGCSRWTPIYIKKTNLFLNYREDNGRENTKVLTLNRSMPIGPRGVRCHAGSKLLCLLLLPD